MAERVDLPNRDQLKEKIRLRRTSLVRNQENDLEDTEWLSNPLNRDLLLFLGGMMSHVFPQEFPRPDDLMLDMIELYLSVFLPLWDSIEQGHTLQDRAKIFVQDFHSFVRSRLQVQWGTGKGKEVGQEAINALLILEPERASECICVCSTVLGGMALWTLDLYPSVITILQLTRLETGPGHVLLVDQSEPLEGFETTRADLCDWDWEPLEEVISDLRKHDHLTLDLISTRVEDLILQIAISILLLPAAQQITFVRQFFLHDPTRPGRLSLESLFNQAKDRNPFMFFINYLEYLWVILPLLDQREVQGVLVRLQNPFCHAMKSYLRITDTSFPVRGRSIKMDNWMFKGLIDLLSAMQQHQLSPTPEFLDCVTEQILVQYPRLLERTHLETLVRTDVFQSELLDNLHIEFSNTRIFLRTLMSQWLTQIDDLTRQEFLSQVDDQIDQIFFEYTVKLIEDSDFGVPTLSSFPLPSDLNDRQELIDQLSARLQIYSKLYSPETLGDMWDDLLDLGLLKQVAKSHPHPWHQVVYLMTLMDEMDSLITDHSDSSSFAWFRDLLKDMEFPVPSRQFDINDLNSHDRNEPWEFLLHPLDRAAWLRTFALLPQLDRTPSQQRLSKFLGREWFAPLVLNWLPFLHDQDGNPVFLAHLDVIEDLFAFFGAMRSLQPFRLFWSRQFRDAMSSLETEEEADGSSKHFDRLKAIMKSTHWIP